MAVKVQVDDFEAISTSGLAVTTTLVFVARPDIVPMLAGEFSAVWRPSGHCRHQKMDEPTTRPTLVDDHYDIFARNTYALCMFFHVRLIPLQNSPLLI